MINRTLLRKFRAMGVLLCSLAFLSGCGLLPQEEEALAPPLVKPKREEYQLVKAERKDLTKYVRGVGSLVSTKESSLFFKDQGRRLKEIQVKSGQQVKKGDVLASVDSGNLDSRMKLQQIALKKLQIQLDSARKTYNDYMALSADKRPAQKDLDNLYNSIRMQELDMEAANIQMNDLKKEYDQTVLVAPINGQVTFVESIKNGEPIEAFKTLITISDTSQLQVFYTTSEAGLVKVGMKADIVINGKKYEGKVVMTPDEAPASTGDKYRTALLVDINNLSPDAGIGSNAEISVAVQSKKNVVVIPKYALVRMFGEYAVRILDGDSKREQSVEVGIETATEVEIVSGLKEGQMVIKN